MSHLHKIVDTDLHFIIDPITRTIENQGDKRYLTQYDHESERFTFGVPRFIEGHDMTLCDRIEIHFTNITKKKDAQNDGMYVVDRDDKEFTDDFFKFSWKVRRESTQLVGILKFSITFLCGNEFSEIIYEWSTTEYKSIQILPKLDHSEEIVAKYPDLFVMLKREIYDEGMVIEDIQQTTTSEESGGINSFTVTLLDGSTRVFNVMNGVDGLPGVYVGSGEPPEDCDIQIDPDGEADEYITKKEFEELLKELPSDVSKDYYDLENHPFERISSIGTVNGTGTTITVDLSILALEEKNFVRYYVNDNNYNIVRFVYNDKSCMITNSTIITIKMLVSGSDRRFVIYLHDQVISFDMIDGGTIFTKETFIGRDEVLPKNNVNEYIPTKDYHPSTKKYVDDAVKDIKDSMNESADIPEEVLTYTEQSLTEEQQMQARKNLGLYSYSNEVVLEHVIDTNDEYKIAERLINNTLENGAEYYCIFAGYYFKCDSATVYQNGPGSFVTEAIFTPLNYALPSSAKIIYDGRWSFDTGVQDLDISGLQTIKVYTKNVYVIPENFIPESIARKEELDQLSGQINDLKENGVVGSSIEPKEDDIPKVFFSEAIPQTKDDVVTGFRYISKTKDISGFAEFKAQGNSSMSYPKKNMTVKMSADESLEEKLKVDFKGWGKQRKHVYKANWIDLTHARNVVSARLWADVVKSRADYELLPELLRTSPNQGAVDGFPVKVYSQGIYQGRYTLNIPKDAWMANMDDSLDNHCILCGENYVSGCFRALAQINESDWTDEIHEVVPSSIKTRWNEVISFVMNSTDEEFKANLVNYFFVDSLIDYFIFGMVSCGLDAFGKNQIYMTYDGMKWIASMYDMDSTWGLYWNGSKFVSANYLREYFEDFVSTQSSGEGNLLYIRLVNLFYEEIQSRYEELKHGALSVTNIINRFERFMDITSLDLVKEDYASTTGGGKFTGIPSQSTNNIQQIRQFVLDRYAYCDEYFANLTPEESVPCTRITLDKTALTFTDSTTQIITATVEPSNTTDKVVWVSNDEDVATVVNGVVMPISNGSCVITATCGNVYATCEVTVNVESDIQEGETFVVYDYSPNGEKFSHFVNNLNFANGDYIEASIDVSACANNNENILSVGQAIDGYSTNGRKIHFYYSPSGSMRLYYKLGDGGSMLKDATAGKGIVKIVMNKDGLYINDSMVEEDGYSDTIPVLTELYIGSLEGTTRSYATYEYIKVVRNESIPDEPTATLLYSLPEATTFNGTSDYIDTGVNLFDKNKDFTILLSILPDTGNTNNATVLHCMKEVTPYYGLTVDCGKSKYRIASESNNVETAIASDYTDRIKIAICKDSSTGQMYVKSNDGAEVTSNVTTDTFEQTTLLGCHITNTGEKARFWAGTIYEAKIYKGALSDEEINELFLPPESLIDIDMTNGYNVGTGGEAYNTTVGNGGIFSDGKFVVNNGGYLSVPTEFIAENRYNKWTIAFAIDSFEVNDNTDGRICRGSENVQGIYYSHSINAFELSLVNGNLWQNAYTSYYDEEFFTVLSDGDINLDLPTGKHTMAFRNDGKNIEFLFDGEVKARGSSTDYRKPSSTFAIGDDTMGGSDLSKLECSMLKVWDIALYNAEIATLT